MRGFWEDCFLFIFSFTVLVCFLSFCGAICSCIKPVSFFSPLLSLLKISSYTMPFNCDIFPSPHLTVHYTYFSQFRVNSSRLVMLIWSILKYCFPDICSQLTFCANVRTEGKKRLVLLVCWQLRSTLPLLVFLS